MLRIAPGHRLLALVVALVVVSLGLPAFAQPVRVEAVEIELVAEREALAPGETSLLGLRIRHDPQWHTYWRNPGDSGLPTTVRLALPEGWSAGGIVWPAPHRVFLRGRKKG